MTLPRVLDNWAAIAFTSNLNEKSSEATRRLKESLREFPATTRNDGYLTELFSEKGKQAYMKNRQEPPKPPSPKRTVNVISGGEDINGVTYTAANKISKVTITQGKRMRYVLEEESITFDDADADGVLSPHNDALILRKFNMKLNPKKCAFGVASEYEAVIAGLELARELGINEIVIKSDSQLVINQVLGTYTAREARMQQYLEMVRDLIRKFQTWKVTLIPRDENVEADALTNLASTADVASNKNASVIHLFHSVHDPDKNEIGIVPEDKRKVHALRKKVARYCLKQGNLYPKMFGSPLARCLRPSQIEYVMREIHEEHCGNHAGGRSLIKRITSTPYHPVGNGQADSTNKIIINNLKKRLEESKGNWPEVLPGVLWAYCTTAKTSTGETPFSLVYGAETLIPVKIGEPSTRFTQASEESNNEEMHINLDLLEGKREAALIRMAAQKQVIERYYNRKARLRFFKIGDFVLKKVFQSMKAANAGKLSPTWEGPDRIHDISGKEAYEMETMDGKILLSH
ncbi:uncharacterized protein [Nicotiana sylvestris]|uniref:uncharacterized protein n=1 Tax=Nicotiana sylvestris TaxID=4096 RepID=UPI00388C74BA